jgi:hypothetical protein
MKKLLISAGALTALAFTSAPAFAQAVPATTQADAHVRIYQPLTLTSVRDLDLGTIVLSGTGPYTDTVGISQAGAFSCGANVTCSGTTQTAQYYATGTQGQTLSVFVSASIPLVNQTQVSPDLTLTVDAPVAGSVVLDAAGEVTFDLGGSIDVSDTTAEGVYLGTFDVSADYQ